MGRTQRSGETGGPGASVNAAATSAEARTTTEGVPHGRPLRLVYVSGDYPVFAGGVSGGIGMHTHTLSRSLTSLGHSVTVIARAQRREVVSDSGALVHGIPTGSRQFRLGNLLPVSWVRWSFAAARQLKQLHAESPFDVAIFPDAYAEGFAFALRPQLPFVVRFGGPASVVQQWDGRRVAPVRKHAERMLERFAPSRASLNVCSSRPFAEDICRQWQLDLKRFRFVRNPLDLTRFRPPEKPASLAEPVVLFAGRVQPLKGIADLVAAIPQVLAASPKVRFKILGNDTKTGPGQSSLRTLLQSQLQAAGAADRVEWLDSVPQTALAEFYRRCALFVLPSHQDVYPNAVLEAMGCGAPCIVTSTTGTAELVSRADAGRVVPPAAPHALAAAILELLRLPGEAREAMGGRARQIVETLCSPGVVGAEAVAVYREAIALEHRRSVRAASRTL